MTVVVYQTFQIKQENFKEGIENIKKLKEYRNENFNHKVEILTPITGHDHNFSLMATYDGLAEMELQNKKMFNDEDYLEIIGEFFIENIVQGSMDTQIFRTMDDKSNKKEDS
ncbi:hypothetical protein [Niallia sp. Krafla_26]|uniref:hypothetical protein n=1 Tax=Niallia sp. Krafla_26 TaxID=3064703 RepID=UPI003D185858